MDLKLNMPTQIKSKKMVISQNSFNREINKVLSYVKISERRVKSFSLQNSSIEGLLECRTPNYTVNPVDYLSSSELMVAIAQLGHILLDAYVDSDEWKHKDKLNKSDVKKYRDLHHIYFTDVSFRYLKKIPTFDYTLKIKLEYAKLIKSKFIGRCNFQVEGGVSGYFTVFIEIK